MFSKTFVLVAALATVVTAAPAPWHHHNHHNHAASASASSNATATATDSVTADNLAAATSAAATTEAAETTASATETSAAAASTSAAASSSDGTTYTGQATYFEVGLGACGWTNTDSDFIVAMNEPMYSSSVCGKYVTITNTANGNTAVAEVVDECPGCASGSLDMSPSLFSSLSNNDLDEGVFPISWVYQ